MQRKRSALRRPETSTLSEIEQELSILADEKVIIQFTPHLVPINRGIITTIYADIAGNVVKIDPALLFNSAYGDEPFVRPARRRAFAGHENVTGTNFIDIAWKIDKRHNRVVVMSASTTSSKAQRPGGAMHESDARPSRDRRVDLKNSFRQIRVRFAHRAVSNAPRFFATSRNSAPAKGSEKGRKDDLALIVSDVPAAVAGSVSRQTRSVPRR